MTQMHCGKPAQTRVHFPRFTIRALFGLIAVTALIIILFQFAWPRRTLQTAVQSPAISVSVLEPHLDRIATGSKTIARIQVDHRTNTIMIHAQARNIDAARNEIEHLIADPGVLVASASLGITVQEARDLFGGP